MWALGRVTSTPSEVGGDQKATLGGSELQERPGRGRAGGPSGGHRAAPLSGGGAGGGRARAAVAAAAGAEPAPNRSRTPETPPRAGDAERSGGRRAAGRAEERAAARRRPERGPAMGFLHQLQLLLWKNVTLKRRSPVSDPARRGPAGAGGCAHRGQRRAPRGHVRRPGRARADPGQAGRRAGDPSPAPAPARAPASGEGARQCPARRPRPLTFVVLG